MNLKLRVLFVLLSVLMISCKKEEETTTIDPSVNYKTGVWIANEGSFGNLNASVTHIAESGTVTSDVFYTSNGVGLGDVLQGMAVYNGKGYAVLNNSFQVKIFNADDFKMIDHIDGLDYPRYIEFKDNKAYISNGSFSGDVKVIDLSTNEIVNSIPVGNGPEQMFIRGDLLYVCNSGGWTTDNTVSVIDLNTESVVATITVGDRPLDIESDLAGNIWVLSSGETLYDENWNVIGHSDAMLNKISQENILVDQYIVGINGDHPRSFDISEFTEQVVLVNGSLWSADLADISNTWAVLKDGVFNSVDCDQETGSFWLTSMPDFVTNSSVYHINSEGDLLMQREAGIGSHTVLVHN
jgi:YVTN family beta-propeller protein